VIHTQASYLASNQNYARTLFLAGYSPQQIIDSMIIRDAQNNPSVRQYGIIKSTTGEKAGYTGSNCLNYKNHLIGPTYTIQGNIRLIRFREIFYPVRGYLIRWKQDLTEKKVH